MSEVRRERDSLGEVDVPARQALGRANAEVAGLFQHRRDLMPPELIPAFALIKRAAATVNAAERRLDSETAKRIVAVCDEILAGEHADMFPLHVWMTGSGTQFNMNVNEVIANRAAEIAGKPLGGKDPRSTPTITSTSPILERCLSNGDAYCRCRQCEERLVPAVAALRDAIATKAGAWRDIVKIAAPICKTRRR